jgi:hypothetical protein
MPYRPPGNEPIEIQAAKIGRNGVIFGAVLTAILTAIFGAIFTPVIGQIALLLDASIKKEFAGNPVALQINSAQHDNQPSSALPGNDHSDSPITLEPKNVFGSSFVTVIPGSDVDSRSAIAGRLPKDDNQAKAAYQDHEMKSGPRADDIKIFAENTDYVTRFSRGSANLDLAPPNTSRRPPSRQVDPDKVVLHFKNATGIPLVLILDDVSYRGLQRVQNPDSVVAVEFPADNTFYAMTNFGQTSGAFLFKVRPVGTIFPYQLGAVNIFYSMQPRLTVVKTGDKDNPFQAVFDAAD